MKGGGERRSVKGPKKRNEERMSSVPEGDFQEYRGGGNRWNSGIV